MNLSPTWVEFLRGAGIDSIHWSTVGPRDAPDEAIVNYADVNRYVVFTHDLDFGTLLARRKSTGPSLIQIRAQDILPSAIGDLVLRAIHASQSQLEVGSLVTIDPARNRIRLLPL